ncbi:Histidinol-phosphate aminotransferase [compost metagenome]
MERERLSKALAALPIVKKIHPSDANFILIAVDDALSTYNLLANQGIIVRDRSKISLCEGCLRITIGTPTENDELLTVLSKIS